MTTLDLPSQQRKKRRQFFFTACLGLISLACGLVSCTEKPTEPKEQPNQGPKLIGRIASVSTNRKFVLIESYGAWDSESGTVLTTRGEENRSANLLVTGETLGRLAAADIQSGDVQRDDQVFSLHIPKPPTAPESLEPER